MKWYILEGKEVRLAKDLLEYQKLMSGISSIIDKTKLEEVLVSTVFLGLDLSYHKNSIPVLFETMVFGGTHDQYQERYCTWNQAVNGHKRACLLVSMAQLTEKDLAKSKINNVLEKVGGIKII